MNAILAIWLAAHSADAITTHISLNRGAVERNPMMTQSAGANDAIFASEAVAMGLVMKKFAPQHPKLAKTLAVAGIALSGYAAVHNIQTIHTQSVLR